MLKMLLFNKKKIIICSIYISFFIAIPLIKNETRLIEKKIRIHKNQILILDQNLLEANLEFQYLTSPQVLTNKVNENMDTKYNNLKASQIYLNIKDFISEQKKAKVLVNEKQKQ
tara:strand:+ start:782 stop:1123 length:342 start_codon:yes stop_codon:yes gene_type:complete